jgi:hypothetical protein
MGFALQNKWGFKCDNAGDWLFILLRSTLFKVQRIRFGL